MFTFYILFSAQLDKFYIGYTSNSIADRLKKHNSNHKGFTGRANDWEVVYFEEFLEKTSAMKREKEVKAWKSKSRIMMLINSVK